MSTSNQKGYKHAGAYCLMLYRDAAGNEEWIWNSRDGVTPFIVKSRQGLDAEHEDWHRDRCLPDHVPAIGDRVFVDLTYERAVEQRTRFVERWWAPPPAEPADYRLRDRYPSKEAAIEELAQADLAAGGGHGGVPDLREVTADWRPELSPAGRLQLQIEEALSRARFENAKDRKS